MMDYAIQLALTCPDGTARYGRATYDGYMYGDTYYKVSAVVTTLADAQIVVDALRVAVKAQHPRWEDITREVRLASSDWRGNPVRVILDFVSRATPDE